MPRGEHLIMQKLVAIDAKPDAKSSGESCVFSPKKPGAEMP